MKQPSTSSEWRVSMLAGAVFGGHCAYCGIILTHQALFQTLYQEHAGHAISVWVRLAAPREYRGLELKLPLELFVEPDYRCLENLFYLPSIVFQLSCLQCQTQRVAGESDVPTFRSSHCGHIHLARLHLVTLNRGGQAVRQTFALRGQRAGQSLRGIQLTPPSSAASARETQLRRLLQALACTPSSIRCGVCLSTCQPKDHSDMEDEPDRHKHHLSELQIEFMVDSPEEYAGLQLRAQANRLPRSLWIAPAGLKLDCVFLQLSRQRGGPKMSPWNAATVESYLRDCHTPKNPALLLTVVRGPRQAYVCQFQVTSSCSSQTVSESKELFLHPEMEEA